jgi:CoA:oxalate CoA-transferase
LLKKNGLPTAAIQNVAEAMQDPQILASEMVQTIPSWTQGLTHKVAGNPVKIGSQTASPYFCAAPKLDQDREKILGWINGQNTL